MAEKIDILIDGSPNILIKNRLGCETQKLQNQFKQMYKKTKDHLGTK